MNTDLDPEEQQRAAEAAFVRSEEYTFRDRTLQPYSFTRQTAAEMLGLRYGRLASSDIRHLVNPRKALLTDGTELSEEVRAEIVSEPGSITVYIGLARDIAIVLWLMHQTDSVARNARRAPQDFEAAIDEWAEEQKIGDQGEHRPEAAALFSQIMSDLAASRGRAVVEEGGKGDAAKKA